MRSCSVPGCNKKYYGYGWCSMHATRMRDHGSLERQPCRRCGNIHHSLAEVGACFAATKKLNSQHTPELFIWKSMKARCLNKNNTSFNIYGGRGIGVCERWASSFEFFLADMGPRPSKNHSIDRIDNNGNYEPSNCRWATLEEQAINKRNTVCVVMEGQKVPLIKVCKEKNFPYSKALARVSIGIKDINDIFNPKSLQPKNSKLTSDQVKQIKELLVSGARGIDVAKRFGVTKATVCDIKFGRIWKEL